MMFIRLPGMITSLLSSRTITKRFPIKYCSSASTSLSAKYFQFNEQETKQILDVINLKPSSELKRFNISKAKLNKIESWKLKNGIFQDLDEILHLDGFSVKVVEKFCNSLLNEVPMKRVARKAASFVTPNIPDTQIAEIQSTVSINVSVSTIVWSRLELNTDGPCSLTHWQRHDLNEQRPHLHDLIHHCLYIAYLIPQADCYLFENPQVAQGAAPGNAEQVNINVQRAQLTAILGFALASRNISEDKTKSNIFYLKRFLAARLFQNLVGTERVSAEKAVLNLMRMCYNLKDQPDTEKEISDAKALASSGNVLFPDQLRQIYKEAEGYHREILGQTLLLNLAFVRLVLLRDASAIGMVTRNSKPSETEGATF